MSNELTVPVMPYRLTAEDLVAVNAPKIAALYVQENGAYWDLPGVDAWPEARDARNYTGPLPVVAHPPCQLWGAMAAVNYARWGGEHNKRINDGQFAVSPAPTLTKGEAP